MRPAINIAPTKFHHVVEVLADHFTKGGRLGSLLGEMLYPVGQVFFGWTILALPWLIAIAIL